MVQADFIPAVGNEFNSCAVWMIAAHEEAPRIDSSQPEVCRFCGSVKPSMGWLTLCLRRKI